MASFGVLELSALRKASLPKIDFRKDCRKILCDHAQRFQSADLSKWRVHGPTSEFAADPFRDNHSGHGEGSGIGAVRAGQWADRVVAVDINPEAIRCARINVLLNRMEDRVEVREGDLFDPLGGERFDVVLFNPPFLPGEPSDALAGAFRSNQIADCFASKLEGHLQPGGYALVVLSSDGEDEAFLEALRMRGFNHTVMAEEDLISEGFRLYKCRKGP